MAVPKLTYPCGFVHDLSPIPDVGWITVRDGDYDELVETERHQGDASPRAFVRLTGRLYECPECGRVMWEKPGEGRFTTFRREDRADENDPAKRLV
jgi:hypothetical protein